MDAVKVAEGGGMDMADSRDKEASWVVLAPDLVEEGKNTCTAVQIPQVKARSTEVPRTLKEEVRKEKHTRKRAMQLGIHKSFLH